MKFIRIISPFLLVLFILDICYCQTYEEDDYLKFGSEKLDNRGLSNSGSIALADNESIGEYDGNLMLTYGLSASLQNGLNVNMSLIFNSNIEHRVFFDTHRDVGPGGYSVNVPGWIVGINGFAVQTTNFENNFYSQDSVGNIGWVSKPLTGTNVALLIPGYHYTNRIEPKRVQNIGRYAWDFIQILMADGSVKILSQVSDTLYAEPNKTDYGYAIVEVTSGQMRKIWYKPGDGLTYYFEEESVNYYYDNNNSPEFNPKIMYLKEIIASNGCKLILEYLPAPCLFSGTRYGRKIFNGVYYKANSNTAAYYVCGMSLDASYLSLSCNRQSISADFMKNLEHVRTSTGNPSSTKIGYFKNIRVLTDINENGLIEDTVKINYVSDIHRNRNYKYSEISNAELPFYFYFPIYLIQDITYSHGRNTKFEYYDKQFDGNSYSNAVDFNTTLYVGNVSNRNYALRDNQTNYMINKRSAYVDYSKSFPESSKIWDETYNYNCTDSYYGAIVEGIHTNISKRNYISPASTYSPTSISKDIVFNKYNIFEYTDLFVLDDSGEWILLPWGYGAMTKMVSKTIDDGSYTTEEKYFYDLDSLAKHTICNSSGTWLLQKKDNIDKK